MTGHDRSGPPDPTEIAPAEPPRVPRPLIERIGLAAIAAVLAILFGGVAAASWMLKVVSGSRARSVSAMSRWPV